MGLGRGQRITKPPPGARIDPSHPLSRGLVGCWLFNEGAGAQVNDLSPTGRPITLIDSPAWDGGSRGATVAFASPAYGRVAAAPALDFTAVSGFSCYSRIRSQTNGSLGAIASQFSDTPSNYSGWMLWLEGGAGRIDLYVNGATLCNATLPLRAWVDVVGTWDGVTLRLYVDGVLEDSTAYAVAPEATGDVIVSGYYNNGLDTGGTPSNLFENRIEGLRLWNRALLPEEVLSLSTAPFAFLSQPVRLFLPADGYGLQVELAGAGNGWTDITDDWRLGYRISYGLPGSGPEDRVARTGTFTFTLDNSDENSAGLLGYYSLLHASRRTGWGLRIRVRLTIVRNGASEVFFLGWIAAIRPEPFTYGSRAVACQAVTWMDYAARSKVEQLPTMLATTANLVFDAIVGAVPTQPAATSVQVGSDTYPYALDTSRGESALTEFQRLAISEYGLIYELRDGTLVFENREARLTAEPILNLTTMQGITVSTGSESIRNSIRAITYPRTVDAAVVVLFTLTNDTELAAAGGTITFTAKYVDPSQRAVQVGGTAMVTPVATTDYLMNSQADGLGSNLTANLAVVVVFGASDALVTLTNNHATLAGHVGGSTVGTLFRLRGKGLYTYEEVVAEAKDQDSIDDYGELPLVLELHYQSSAVVGQAVAENVLMIWKDPAPDGVSVTLCADASTALMDAMHACDISSAIAVEETVTGLNRVCWINAVDITGAEDGSTWVTWGLGRAETQEYWELGIAGLSELGETTVLAPL